MASKVSNVGGNPNNVGSGIAERMTLRSVVNNFAHDDLFGAIQSVVSHVLGTKPAGNVNDETTMTNDGNEQASASFIEMTGVTHRGAGEYADVMARLTSDEHKAIMVEALWKKFLAKLKVESAPVVNNVNDRFQKVVKNKRNTNTGPTRPRSGFSGFVPSCFADLGLVPLSLSLFVLCHIGSWVFGQHFILCLYLESIQIELAEVFAFNLELFMDRLSLLNEHEHVTRLVHFGFSTQRLEQIAPVQLFNDWSEMSIEITCVSP
ncbi:hypothetical protein Tco_0951555 [Tanacetum coccineum]|uniref:Uncharacterized protein n=1 Tax=Tanacetum coccineum TaxID=301880 RepID=A0ABQ5DUH5_9ASTR